MCELGARIIPGDAKCQQYRLSVSESCRSCEFVAGVVMEAKAVDRTKLYQGKQLRKGDKFYCPECDRENAVYESGGLCGVCNAKRRKAKRLAATMAAPAESVPGESAPSPLIKAPVYYPDLEVFAATSAKSKTVTPRLQDVIRCMLEGVERRLLVDVADMPDDAAIIYVARVVQAMAVVGEHA